MIQGYDPRTGKPVGQPVPETSDAELDAIVAAAAPAAPAWPAPGRPATAALDGLVHGVQAGLRLLRHPAIAAAGFTGSTAGGLALARKRP